MESDATAAELAEVDSPLSSPTSVAGLGVLRRRSLFLDKEQSPVLFRSGDLSPRGAREQQRQQRLAAMLLERGKARDALQLVEKALPGRPDDTNWISLRGQCYLKMDSPPAAYACFVSALKLDPKHVDSLMGLAALYNTKEMMQECIDAATKAHNLRPEDKMIREMLAIALMDMGTKLKIAGDMDRCIENYKRALEVCEDYGPACYNLGVVHYELNEKDKALEYYKKAAELQPNYAQAHCNMGVIHKEQSNLELAIQCYEKALVCNPNFQTVHNNLATALSELGTKLKMEGKFDEGVAMYERALGHNPKHVQAVYNLGVAYGESGHLDRAIFMYEMALGLESQCAEAWNNLGVVYKDKGNMEKAIHCYTTALQIRPNFPQSLNNLGVIFTSQGRAQEAMALLQASVQACPTYAEAYNNIGVVQRDVALVEEAIGSYEKCLQLCPGSRNAGQNRLLALNYIFPGEDGRVCKAHSEWGEEFERTMQPLPPVSRSDWDTNPNRVLRVGYISPDLYTHSVAFFADAPLSHHNQEAVKHVVYSCVPQADANTARLRQAVQKAGGEWKDVVHLSERQLAGLVRQDKIDVLVELSGHTANNRLGTMALRPAPIQVTWIGYPNSTGLRSVDYRFTDVNCDPVSTRQTFTEELVRLPGCFLCYTPLVNPPPVAAAPCVRNGFITFGSFNGLAKITPEVIKLWCRILLSVPSARFVLKQKPLVCETTKAHLLQLFAAEGIESWRVDLLPAIPQTYDHLAMYSLMDVSLDPFPYAGTTTTCESLFMGVPCLTLKGHCHAHNVGVSLVRAVGLEEHWLASTQEEYLQLAVEASQDFERLEELRSGLRDRMLKSPLCDAPAFMPKLESTYRSLWTRWLKQSGEGGDCVSLEPSQMPHKRKNSNELELQRKASREGTQVETSPEQGC